MREKEARLREFAQLLSERIDAVSGARGPACPREAFRTFADTLPAVVWTARPDGTPTFHSRHWHETFGQGANYSDVIHPDDRARVDELWRACVESGDTYSHLARFLTKNGVYVALMTHAHAVRTESGAVAYWIGSSTEVPRIAELRCVA